MAVVLLTDCTCSQLDAVSRQILTHSWCEGSLRSMVACYGTMQACISTQDAVFYLELTCSWCEDSLRSLVAPVECSSTWGGMHMVMKGTMPLPTLTSLDTGWMLSLCCKGCALLSFTFVECKQGWSFFGCGCRNAQHLASHTQWFVAAQHTCTASTAYHIFPRCQTTKGFLS